MPDVSREAAMPKGDATFTDADAKADAADVVTGEDATDGRTRDAPADAPGDVAFDAPSDGRVDGSGDGAVDGPMDAAKDAPADGGTDAPRETSAEAAIDAPADVRDAAPDSAADAPADARGDAPVEAAGDGCVGSAEICDGLDNNCDGHIDEGSICPSGCVGLARNGAGYMFCYVDPAINYRTWPDAQADCAAMGMHLVRVDDSAENAFINASAVGLGFLEEIWLGASYSGDSDEWSWTDGTVFWRGDSTGGPAAGLFSSWNSGEPHNFAGIANCATKRFGNTTVWQDLNCTRTFAYMCER